MKEFLEMLWYWILIILWFLLVYVGLLFLVATPIKYIECKQLYTDTQYKILWWCMIKYNWEYIPEHLYIKAFEQNVNLK